MQKGFPVNLAGDHVLPAGLPPLDMECLELNSRLMFHGEREQSYPRAF